MTSARRRHGPPSSVVPARDEAWFDDLFRTHHRVVLAFARRRVPGHADDVVAEVFAVAWRRRDEVPDDPLPWLYRTAGNHVLLPQPDGWEVPPARRGDARRSRTVAAAAARDGVEPAADDLGDSVAAALDSRALIRGALDSLREADREVLRLWAWEGLEVADIAYVLRCSRGAARVRLHRALRRLRAAAAPDPGAPTARPTTSARPDTLPAAIRSEA